MSCLIESLFNVEEYFWVFSFPISRLTLCVIRYTCSVVECRFRNPNWWFGVVIVSSSMVRRRWLNCFSKSLDRLDNKLNGWYDTTFVREWVWWLTVSMRMDNNQKWMITLKMDVMSAIPFFVNSLITLSLIMSCPRVFLELRFLSLTSWEEKNLIGKEAWLDDWRCLNISVSHEVDLGGNGLRLSFSMGHLDQSPRGELREGIICYDMVSLFGTFQREQFVTDVGVSFSQYIWKHSFLNFRGNFLIVLFSFRLSSILFSSSLSTSECLLLCHNLRNFLLSSIFFFIAFGYLCWVIYSNFGVEERHAFIMLFVRYSTAASIPSFVFSGLILKCWRIP